MFVCMYMYVCVCSLVCGRKRRRETDLSFLYKRGGVCGGGDAGTGCDASASLYPHGRQHIHRFNSHKHTHTHRHLSFSSPSFYLRQSQALRRSSITYYIPVPLHPSTVSVTPFVHLQTALLYRGVCI